MTTFSTETKLKPSSSVNDMTRLAYKGNAVVLVMLCLACLALSAYCAHEALYIDHGITFRQRIELSTEWAKVFFAITSLALLWCAVASAAMLFHSIFSDHEIIVTPTSITFPKGIFFTKTTTIRFLEIKDLRILKAGFGTRSVIIKHINGNEAIRGNFLSKSDFAALVAYLDYKQQRSRANIHPAFRI